MKPLTSLVLAIMLTLFASATEINFVKKLTWKQIKEKAVKENKMIFFDAYATWCGPCKYLEEDVYTDDGVASYYNANYINVKMDMEAGEGLILSKEFAITSYPTLLFFSPAGKLVHKAIGAMDPPEFIELGKKAKNPSTQYFPLKEKAGKLALPDNQFTEWVAMAEKLDDEDRDAIIVAYLASKPDLLANKDLATTVLLYRSSLTDMQLSYLYNNKTKIGKLMNWDEEQIGASLYKKLFSQAVAVYGRAESNIDSFTTVIRKFDPAIESFAVKDFKLRIAVYVDKDFTMATDLLIAYMDDQQKPTSLADLSGWLLDYASSLETVHFQKLNDHLSKFKLRPIDNGNEYWLWLMQVVCADTLGDTETSAKFAKLAYDHPGIPKLYKDKLKELYAIK